MFCTAINSGINSASHSRITKHCSGKELNEVVGSFAHFSTGAKELPPWVSKEEMVVFSCRQVVVPIQALR